MAAASKTITFPCTFGADISYRFGAGLFSLIAVLALGTARSSHDHTLPFVLAATSTLFFVMLVLALSFRLTVDADGLHQQSVMGRRDVPWESVRRLDRGRVYSIHAEGSRELVWLGLLPTAAQQAIAEEAIRRADLHPSDAKMQEPVRQQWVK
jgi:hypothetical protein